MQHLNMRGKLHVCGVEADDRPDANAEVTAIALWDKFPPSL